MSKSGAYPTADLEDIEMTQVSNNEHEDADVIEGSLEDRLPFPTWRDGKMCIDYRNLQQNKTILIDWTKEFKLPYSRKKVSELQDQLIEFSQLGQDKWVDALTPGVRRSHRGPRSGPRKTKMKLSYQRHYEQFGPRLVEATIIPDAGPPLLSSTHMDDPRSEEEKNELLLWAKEITHTFPYKQPSLLTSVPSVTLPRPGNTHDEGLSRLTTKVSELSQAIAALTSSSSLLSPKDSLHHLASTTAAVSEPDTTNEDINTSISISLQPTPHPSRDLCPPASAIPTRLLQLGNGTLLTFTENDVPDPPASSFAKDISRLNAMWDDMSSFWAGKSDLIILGQPIALCYWRDVYRYWKIGCWDGIKQNWHDWEAVVMSYRAHSPDEFWAAFSDGSGNRLPWTSIVARLRISRINDDHTLTLRAYREYPGELFSTYFTYRKGSHTGIMKKESAIANRYRKLKGLGSKHNQSIIN
ncbi:hypothetical protein C0992_006082 [Termitomyces sp. T32_za158]|nr:hypothetical protein C0992_006082 [Termitomyces sp. T32_za158]